MPANVARIEATLGRTDHCPVGCQSHVVQRIERFNTRCSLVPSNELLVTIVVDPRVPFAVDTELEPMHESDSNEFFCTSSSSYFSVGKKDAVRMLVLTGQIKRGQSLAEESNEADHFFVPGNVGHGEITGTRVAAIGHALVRCAR